MIEFKRINSIAEVYRYLKDSNKCIQLYNYNKDKNDIDIYTLPSKDIDLFISSDSTIDNRNRGNYLYIDIHKDMRKYKNYINQIDKDSLKYLINDDKIYLTYIIKKYLK